MKALAARLGLEVASLGGHALRSGFLTSAAAAAPRSSRWPISRGTRAWTHCGVTVGEQRTWLDLLMVPPGPSLCENAKNRKVARMIFLRLAAIEPL